MKQKFQRRQKKGNQKGLNSVQKKLDIVDIYLQFVKKWLKDQKKYKMILKNKWDSLLGSFFNNSKRNIKFGKGLLMLLLKSIV